MHSYQSVRIINLFRIALLKSGGELKDVEKLVKKLMENNAMQKRNGRKLKCYSDISPSLISDVDLQGLFKWINDHKKLVSEQKTAR